MTGMGDSDERLARSAQAVIRHLVTLGADRRFILAACQNEGQFMPSQLADTVAELQRHGCVAGRDFGGRGQLALDGPTQPVAVPVKRVARAKHV